MWLHNQHSFFFPKLFT